MDSEILLALQRFREGGGGFLAEFLSKMTLLGELNTVIVIMALIYWCAAFLIGWVLERRWVGFSTDVPVSRKLTRAAAGLLGYYAVSLIAVPLLKNGIPGAAGTVISCFVQLFYVIFLFPWLFRRLEKPGKAEMIKSEL